MSLDFPKRSARKILEQIIPPPLGWQGQTSQSSFYHCATRRYNSSSQLQFTLYLKLGAHYQRVSLKISFRFFKFSIRNYISK